MVVMKSFIVWDIKPSSPLKFNRCIKEKPAQVGNKEACGVTSQKTEFFMELISPCPNKASVVRSTVARQLISLSVGWHCGNVNQFYRSVQFSLWFPT